MIHMCVYLFSLPFWGNLAPCSAFTNLRGDEWRNFKRKIAYDIVEKILPVFLPLCRRHASVHYITERLSVDLSLKNNSWFVKKSIKKFIVTVYTLVTLFY
jgi:hypothetical protein